MPKLSIGYQHSDEIGFSSYVTRYRDRIEEVYFAWVDQPSGRSMVGGYDGYFDYSIQSAMVEELRRIKGENVKLHLLFNGNCYGDEALSKSLAGRVYSIIDYLSDMGIAPDGITTTSPAIAFMIKERYEGIDLRASVNMRIGSIKGIKYQEHLFDSFCLAKECNRDLDRLREIKAYAEERGKRISILANSGCFRDCSGQIFHDNLVAHEAGISCRKNIDFMPYTCWSYLRDRENHHCVLENTWIRPEDIHNYEGLCDIIKLATRMHALPGMVIDAYAREQYSGNLLDIFEPGHGPALAPVVVDNDRFPTDWFERTTACDKCCERCGYCRSVAERVFVNAEM